MGGWNVDVGGALTVTDEAGVTVELRPKERAIVAAITLVHPDAASVADLTELIWDHPPATARKAIHNHVARLRRSVDGLVESVEGGYRLGDSVIVAAPTTDDVFRDLVDHPEVAIARTRFRDARLHDEEERAASRLERHPDDRLIDELIALADDEPHRLERWRLVAIALARRGRRLAALERVRQARRSAAALPDDRHRLDRLERAILDDDPRLDVDEFLRSTDRDTEAATARAELADGGRANDLFVDAGGVLDGVVARIDAGSTGCLVVAGPAGSGKTTVCVRARERAAGQGWETHRVEARSHASAGAHLVSALSRSLRRRRGDAGPDAADDAAVTTCRELLIADGRRRLVVVDDLHHASADESASLATLIAETSDAGQVCWVVASRSTPEIDDAVVLEMAPWDAPAVGQLLHRFVPPSPWLDDAAAWIAQQADGNALAIRELVVDAVRRREQTTDDAGRFVAPSGGSAPVEWVRRRVDELDHSARRALSGVAMVGVEFGLSSLRAFTDDPIGVVAHARLDGVIAAVPDQRQRFRFVHDLFRDVLLDGLDDDERAELALIALRDPMFDDDAESRRRSMLARLAVQDDPERAIEETIEAAELELERQQPVEGERLLRRAIELMQRHGATSDLRHCSTMIELGSAALSNGRDDAVDILLHSASLAIELGEPRLAARATYESCRIGLGSSVGESDTAVADVIAATRTLPLDPESRATVDVAEMSIYGIGTDGDRARAQLDAALQAADESGSPDVRAFVQRSAYMAVLRPDDLPVRRSIADELRRRGAETGDLTMTYEATRLDFSIAVESGERDPRPLLAELERMHAHFGERSRNWSLFAFQCVVAYLDGDMDRLQRGIERILSPETAVSTALKMSTAGGHQVGLHLRRGDIDVLDPLVAHIEASTPGLPVWTAARALTAAAAGDHAVARERLDQSRVDGDDGVALRLPADFTGLPSALLLGEAARLVGDDEILGAAIDALRPYSGMWIWHGTGTLGPVDLALARWHSVRAADPGTVRSFARRALRTASVVGAPHLIADAAQLVHGSSRHDAGATG